MSLEERGKKTIEELVEDLKGMGYKVIGAASLGAEKAKAITQPIVDKANRVLILPAREHGKKIGSWWQRQSRETQTGIVIGGTAAGTVLVLKLLEGLFDMDLL